MNSIILERELNCHFMVVGLAGLQDARWKLGIVDKIGKVLSLQTKATVKCVIATALKQFNFYPTEDKPQNDLSDETSPG